MIMPKIPEMLLRPIMPKVTDNKKIVRKNHNEFHHLAAGAEKQTTSQSHPAIAPIRPVMPNVLCEGTKLLVIPPP